MSKAAYPLTIEEKHKVLYREPLTPPELVSLGDRYAEAGLWHDALEFYEKAGDGDRIRRTRDAALDAADSVLYLNACRALGEPTGEEGLNRLRDRARDLGKEAAVGRVEELLLEKAEETSHKKKGETPARPS